MLVKNYCIEMKNDNKQYSYCLDTTTLSAEAYDDIFNGGPSNKDFDYTHTIIGTAQEGYTQAECEANPDHYWKSLCGRWMAVSYDFNKGLYFILYNELKY